MSIHHLSPGTIETLRTARRHRLEAAAAATAHSTEMMRQATKSATNAQQSAQEAEDLRSLLADACPGNSEYDEPAETGGTSAQMLANIHAAAALLANAELPEQLAGTSSPTLSIRLRVAGREQAQKIITALEATPGSWYNHSPRDDEKYHWLQTSRYGTPLHLEVTVDYDVYVDAAPDETEADPAPQADELSASTSAVTA